MMKLSELSSIEKTLAGTLCLLVVVGTIIFFLMFAVDDNQKNTFGKAGGIIGGSGIIGLMMMYLYLKTK